MSKKISLLISYLFHPLILPTLSFFLLIAANPYRFAGIEATERMKFVLMVFINTFIFPVITVALMKKLKFIDSFYLENRKERVLPYIATAVFFIWSFTVFRKMQVPQILALSLLGATMSVFASFLINIFTKISMHTVGMGCLFGITLITAFISSYDIRIPLMLVILLGGIVGTARLALNAHQPSEIFAGYFVGFLCQAAALWFF